jgi:hypothetical protein
VGFIFGAYSSTADRDEAARYVVIIFDSGRVASE